MPTIPDVRLLCCCVIDPCPVNHCSHSIFLWKDKVLRPPVEPATENAVSGWHHPCGRSCARGISASMHVIFEPVDFIAKLAALVPKPRINLTRLHGVFASNSKHRALVTPAKRGKGSKSRLAEGRDEKTPVQRYVAMTWAQRLKRVFTNSRCFRRY